MIKEVKKKKITAISKYDFHHERIALLLREENINVECINLKISIRYLLQTRCPCMDQGKFFPKIIQTFDR